MESVINKMQKKLAGYKKGQLLFASDFLEAGSNDAVKVYLSRMVKEGVLVRIAHGIYLYPQYDDELGLLYPSFEKIAAAIARKDNAVIRPTGAYALHRLGLTTQIPLRIVYFTNGSTRSVKLGKRTIFLKHTSPRNLAAKGKYSSLVIAALQELGKNEVNDKVIARIEPVLRNEKIRTIKNDAKYAPAWIAALLTGIIKKIEKDAEMA